MSVDLKDGMMSCFDVTLDRRPAGVTIHVKADPRVEEFMAGLGYGESDGSDMYGRLWVPNDPTKPLKIYKLSNDLEGRFKDRYTISQPCGQFDHDGILNLSFLRLVGIGSDDGVSFRIELPMSRNRVGSLSKQLTDGVNEFLREYIVPVHVTLKLISLPF